ncbi:MAG: hypothetical protein FWE33_08060 [Defluviitaleaceae bacterium]|nr:hypothetical protein [Defluviitaleaceae bacterium]
MKKTKCFYCNKIIENSENIQEMVVDFQRMRCCNDECITHLRKHIDFFQSRKKWLIWGLALSFALFVAIIPIAVIFQNIWLTVSISALSWGLLGLVIFVCPFYNESTMLWIGLKRTIKMTKVSGIILMATSPLWIIIPFLG